MNLSQIITYIYINYIDKLVDYLTFRIPPGNKCIPIRYIINIQKGLTGVYVFLLMYYYNNWTISAIVYLALHGTYGIIWLLKDKIIPDNAWKQKATISSICFIFVSVLGPYWVAPYLLITRKPYIKNWVILSSIGIHTIGCVLMMASDTQKFWILKYKKGLINNGWFSRCRNTNYLGEMMIYSSYALLSQHHIPWYILGYIWSILFARNIIKKEESLKKKDGWDAYKNNSGCLFPKINGNILPLTINHRKRRF
tara:strand:+ start:341 stop:1099 length:759 start_codon:yes stop_codon:yes gene_type:complete